MGVFYLSIDHRATRLWVLSAESTTTRKAGGLDFQPWDGKTEARLCCDVELAVAPGFGKNKGQGGGDSSGHSTGAQIAFHGR
jgi:hypothetical protein